MGPGDLACGVRGRGHHHGDVPESESHERAVGPREVAQGAVRGRDPGEVVQVADDRHRPWPRRWPELALGVIPPMRMATGQYHEDDDG